jgi:hypothetical protein
MNKSLKIRVKHSGVIELPCFNDLPDGNLFIAESQKHILFDINRVYYINNLANPKAVRGRHAHKVLEQVLFCISGSFVLHLDDGTNKQRIKLNDPSRGVRIGPRLWHTMSRFSYDCIILVFADAWFDPSDYIRDYDTFLQFVKDDSSG